MTTKRMMAHAPASPMRLPGVRESADDFVIRSLTLHALCGLVKSAALRPSGAWRKLVAGRAATTRGRPGDEARGTLDVLRAFFVQK